MQNHRPPQHKVACRLHLRALTLTRAYVTGHVFRIRSKEDKEEVEVLPQLEKEDPQEKGEKEEEVRVQKNILVHRSIYYHCIVVNANDAYGTLVALRGSRSMDSS